MIKAKECGAEHNFNVQIGRLVIKNLSLAKYQKKSEKNNHKMINMLKKYELSEKDQSNCINILRN